MAHRRCRRRCPDASLAQDGRMDALGEAAQGSWVSASSRAVDGAWVPRRAPPVDGQAGRAAPGRGRGRSVRGGLQHRLMPRPLFRCGPRQAVQRLVSPKLRCQGDMPLSHSTRMPTVGIGIQLAIHPRPLSRVRRSNGRPTAQDRGPESMPKPPSAVLPLASRLSSGKTAKTSAPSPPTRRPRSLLSLSHPPTTAVRAQAGAQSRWRVCRVYGRGCNKKLIE